MVPTSHGAPEASSIGACEARPEAVVDGGRDPRLPRPEPPRLRQAIRKWCLIAPPSLAPLRLAAWALLHPRHALVFTLSAWVGSAWTSPPSVRGRSLRVAVDAPSDR